MAEAVPAAAMAGGDIDEGIFKVFLLLFAIVDLDDGKRSSTTSADADLLVSNQEVTPHLLLAPARPTSFCEKMRTPFLPAS
jgi:hypothetical protein